MEGAKELEELELRLSTELLREWRDLLAGAVSSSLIDIEELLSTDEDRDRRDFCFEPQLLLLDFFEWLRLLP